MFDVRIAVDQTTEEKANKNTETPSGLIVYSLKLGAVVCYSVTTEYRRFFKLLGGMVRF